MSRGINVSRLVEQAITRGEDHEEFTPNPGSAVYKLMNLNPESEKLENYG